MDPGWSFTSVPYQADSNDIAPSNAATPPRYTTESMTHDVPDNMELDVSAATMGSGVINTRGRASQNSQANDDTKPNSTTPADLQNVHLTEPALVGPEPAPATVSANDEDSDGEHSDDRYAVDDPDADRSDSDDHNYDDVIQHGGGQQPVNWAPAGIDNMSPDWVHSIDAAEESYDCKICTDAPGDPERVFLDCGHVFCADCLNENFRNALSSKANFPPKCCRRTGISLSVIEPYLEEDVLIMVMQNWEEWSAADPTFCQTPGCCAGMIPDHFIIDQWALCKTCGNKTCTECKSLESKHESSDKHVNTLSKEDEELMKTKGWKQCPKCRKLIERIDGCDHMQCSACQTEFCYRCGAGLKYEMGCNCQGQNPWVNGVQADLQAQNGTVNHDDDIDDVAVVNDDNDNTDMEDQRGVNNHIPHAPIPPLPILFNNNNNFDANHLLIDQPQLVQANFNLQAQLSAYLRGLNAPAAAAPGAHAPPATPQPEQDNGDEIN